MICPKCNQPISEESKVCSSCGESMELIREKIKVSHFSATINSFGLVIIIVLWWWLFPSEVFRIIFGFFLLLMLISYGIPMVFSLFKIASITKVMDFKGYAYGGMTFFRTGKETSRFFGLLRNYTIKNEDVAIIIKSKFLFLNRYEIYFYREKSLSYVQAVTFFWNLEKKFPANRVVILPVFFTAGGDSLGVLKQISKYTKVTYLN